MTSTRHFEGSFYPPYVLFCTEDNVVFKFGGVLQCFSAHLFISQYFYHQFCLVPPVAPRTFYSVCFICIPFFYIYILDGYYTILVLFNPLLVLVALICIYLFIY